MRSARSITMLVATLVASVLPVLQLTPAMAAPEAALVELVPTGWSSSPSGWKTSETMAGETTVLVAADWGGAHDVAVQVRTLRDDSWTEWTRIKAGDDDGPSDGEAGAESTASDPVYIGIIELMQFRTNVADPSLVTFNGVQVDGGEKAMRFTPDGNTPASTAEAAVEQPRIFSRAEWGADESRRKGTEEYAESVRFAVIHHTAGTNDYESWESDDIVNSIYIYHTAGRGWDDIGYNFLVDRFGQVFEGRRGGIDRAVMGAHAAGFNSGSTGIAMMGDYRGGPPTTKAKNGLIGLLRWKLDLHHIDPKGTTTEVAGGGSRFREGSTVKLNNIVGHIDVGYSECPGASMYDLIESGWIANQVAGASAPRLYTDAPASFQQPRSSVVAFGVEPSKAVRWTISVFNEDEDLVHTESGSNQGTINVRWDQTGADGRPVPAGLYRFVVSASASGQQAHPIEVSVRVVTDPPVADPNAAPFPPPAGATMISGDWDGDGIDSPGWFKDGYFGLHDRSHAKGNTRILRYGQTGDTPVVGDWDGDGVDTVGVVRGNTFILRNEYVKGAEDIVLAYGRATDTPVTGDWDGDGKDTIGVVRGNLWILRNEYRRGAEDIVMAYGEASDAKVTGDWNGDGRDTLGVVRGNLWILRSHYRKGANDVVMAYGQASDAKVTGDWNADSTDTLGIERGRTWALRNEYVRNAVDYVFKY